MVQGQVIQGPALKIEPYLLDDASQAKGYYVFDLATLKQALVKVRLTNTSAQAIDYQAQLKDAVTDSNGQVAYQGQQTPYGIRQFCDQPNRSGRLSTGQTRTLVFKLSLPDQPALTATYLGALVITQDLSKAKMKSSQMQNEFTAITSIVLQQSQADSQTLSPLHLVKVEPGREAGQNGYLFTLDNRQAKILAKVPVKLTVWEANQQRVSTRLPKVTMLAHGRAKLFLPADVTTPLFKRAQLEVGQGNQKRTLTFTPVKSNQQKKAAQSSRLFGWWQVILGLFLGLSGLGFGYWYYQRRGGDDSE